MTLDQAVAGAASTWAIAMALSPLLQARKMLVQHSSEGVSVGYFLVLIVGFMLWSAYGLTISNFVIVIPNAVATVVGVATVVIALRLRR